NDHRDDVVNIFSEHRRKYSLRHRGGHFPVLASSGDQHAPRQIFRRGDSHFHPATHTARARLAVPFLSSPIEKAPRAALFDVGRVIIRVDLSRSLAALGLRKGMSHIQVRRELESDRRWADWQEGRMPPRDWHAHLSKKLHFSYNFEEFCAIWNSVLEA